LTPYSEKRLHELATKVKAFEATEPGSTLASYFEEHLEAPGAVLTCGGAFAAAISRQEFLDVLAQPLGPGIFLQRPLSALVERPAYRPMLILPGDLSAADALARAMERPGAQMHSPVLIEGTGAVADFRALVAATLEAHDATRRELDAETARRTGLEEALADARRETSEIRLSKSEFLSTVSHEIRTPMNGVVGMTGLLLESGMPPREREYARTIQKSAAHLLEILNEFLDFSKAEAHVLTLDTVDFDLLGVVEDVTEKYGPQAGEKGIELAEFVASTVPTHLRGDPARLGQVLDYLVGNGVKFTTHGEVVVSVSRETESADDVLLRFEVRDTGIGIAPEERETIFEPFRRNTDPSTRKVGGAGLGLAISKEVAQLMGGEIGVQCPPEGGSLFWFTARFEKQTRIPESATAPLMDLCGVRALIVDDNPTNRHILHCQLSSWRMVPTCVSNAREALSTLKRALDTKPFDVALLDMQMPETNGLALARAIKEDAVMASTRLIILTSMGRIPQQDIRNAGVSACLVKPVKQSLLYNQIATVVAQEHERTGSDAASPSPMKPVRILVAEDNVINQIVTLGQLEKLGYKGDLAVNGQEVLSALRKYDYPIILMDCQMPLMDGYEATRRIRANEDLPRQPRIIAVTAHAMAGDSAKCLAAGMDDYISKPVKLEDLASKLAHWENAPSAGGPTTEPQPAAPLASSAPGEPEPLDRERLDTLKTLDPDNSLEFYGKLLETFLNSAEADFRALRMAIEERAWERAKNKAHSLKGSSRNMGADRMGEICQDIEALTAQPDRLAELQAALERLAREFNRVCQQIHKEQATL